MSETEHIGIETLTELALNLRWCRGRFEIYANAPKAAEPERHAMTRGRKLDAPGEGYLDEASIPVARTVGDYAPRLIPYHPAAVVALDAHQILWQR